MAHHRDAYSFRRRLEATQDAKGKPQVILTADLLDMIGVEPGDQLIVHITPDGAILGKKSQND